MTKFEIVAEHTIVTFFEAAVAYLIVIPTVNWNRTVLAGAIGAGISAVYNTVRQATPNVPEVAPVTVVSPTIQSTPEVLSVTAPLPSPTPQPPVTSVDVVVPPSVGQGATL
jgi:hypothetical protein